MLLEVGLVVFIVGDAIDFLLGQTFVIILLAKLLLLLNFIVSITMDH